MSVKGNAKDWQTKLRLYAAIIMGCYATGYIFYYAMGLISPDSMENYLDAMSRFWPVFFIIPIAITIHIALGLWKLFKRNTLKMPLWEMSQIFLGLCIPIFLFPQINDTYGLIFLGGKEGYQDQVLMTYPALAWQFIGMTLVIGIHAQIGVHAVLRMRRWYPKVRLAIVIFLSLIPVIGIAGYLKGGKDIKQLVLVNKEEAAELHPATEAQHNAMEKIDYSVYLFFPLLYAGVFASRGARIRIRSALKNITVRYSSGEAIRVFPETTILEASRIGNIPHASICGGRGRCTTCRVKINSGDNNLSQIGDREHKALKRIAAEKDIRLACQAECRKDSVDVTLLLPPDINSQKARKETKLSIGKEIELPVFFADLRGFTRLSEEKFPYDIVFILNHYFSYMGEVIEENGGIIDKFLGDGILAYFGFDTDSKTGCRQALNAARQMAEKLIDVNKELAHVFKEPLELGIGIHFGEVIVGEVGYKDKFAITIIGDTVNTASRLESMNKKAQSQMIFSHTVAEKTEYDMSRFTKYKAVIRGKKEPLEIYIVKDILNEVHNLVEKE
jgi:adenylate cyclase